MDTYFRIGEEFSRLGLYLMRNEGECKIITFDQYTDVYLCSLRPFTSGTDPSEEGDC